MPERAAVRARLPESVTDRRALVEACRARLQSVELLLASSPRDALALATALLDEVVALRAALPVAEEARAAGEPGGEVSPPADTMARRHLDAARRCLQRAEGAGAIGPDGIVALRRVVADLARDAGSRDRTALAMLGRTTWLQRGIAAAVVLLLLLAAWQARASRDRRIGEFDALVSQGKERLEAGDRAQAVELLRRAIAVAPEGDRTAGAWNDLGWTLLQLGRDEEAIAAFRKALLLRPVFPLARNNLDAAQRRIDLKKSRTP
jgi:tetratricopeptide (TPR) repeat protein